MMPLQTVFKLMVFALVLQGWAPKAGATPLSQSFKSFDKGWVEAKKSQCEAVPQGEVKPDSKAPAETFKTWFSGEIKNLQLDSATEKAVLSDKFLPEVKTCSEAAGILGFLSWSKKSSEMASEERLPFLLQKRVFNDVKTGDELKKLTDINPVFTKAESIPKNLKGLIDGEELQQYADRLRVWHQRLNTLKLNQILQFQEMFDGESLSVTAEELREARQLYSMTQKGQWESAYKTAKAYRDRFFTQGRTPGFY